MFLRGVPFCVKRHRAQLLFFLKPFFTFYKLLPVPSPAQGFLFNIAAEDGGWSRESSSESILPDF